MCLIWSKVGIFIWLHYTLLYIIIHYIIIHYIIIIKYIPTFTIKYIPTFTIKYEWARDKRVVTKNTVTNTYIYQKSSFQEFHDSWMSQWFDPFKTSIEIELVFPWHSIFWKSVLTHPTLFKKYNLLITVPLISTRNQN